jgi:predicted DNA-binding WGR domain protein
MANVNIPVDEHCPIKSKATVHDDYDCMLNQTNIGANNNKFYVIQVLESAGKYYAWTRWGRVGEVGQSALKGPFASPDQGIKEFESKFKDKSSNAWANRKNFKSPRRASTPSSRSTTRARGPRRPPRSRRSSRPSTRGRQGPAQAQEGRPERRCTPGSRTS